MPIPKGYHTITPYICVRDAARAIDFYKRALGATEIMRMPSPEGKIFHAELQIGDSRIMLSEECDEASARSPQALGGTTTNFFIYTEDVDRAFNQAVQAGAKPEMPPTDMFWGDRYSKLVDPFGHSWALAKHIKDVSPEEMQKGAQEAFAKMSQRTKTAG